MVDPGNIEPSGESWSPDAHHSNTGAGLANDKNCKEVKKGSPSGYASEGRRVKEKIEEDTRTVGEVKNAFVSEFIRS